eukprot:gb/GEZN01015038.1/.p1 GENE.gb/GEZN01015038.1/~~gb/GEZN01015038.1/.p1  ORF type:complete len:128 (-),score=3.27 gb/GEZN01015038.1/:59-442(-)
MLHKEFEVLNLQFSSKQPRVDRTNASRWFQSPCFCFNAFHPIAGLVKEPSLILDCLHRPADFTPLHYVVDVAVAFIPDEEVLVVLSPIAWAFHQVLPCFPHHGMHAAALPVSRGELSSCNGPVDAPP